MWNVQSGAIREKYTNSKLIIEIWLCLVLSYYILCKTAGYQAGLALRHHFTAASESILRMDHDSASGKLYKEHHVFQTIHKARADK